MRDTHQSDAFFSNLKFLNRFGGEATLDFYRLLAAKAAVAVAATLLSIPANAQDSETEAKGEPIQKKAPSSNLEEITVTARKRAESLQEVPLSISAFSADQLKSAGATNNYDVALLTPNFSTNRQLGRRLDRPVIRGQSAPAVGGEPNASYFVDGAFVSGSISSATLGPVERVEILRGPQSATFGRATFSGAVNYVTRKPTDEFEGEVRTVFGSEERVQINGWASGPIVADKLRFFVAAGTDHYGGEWRNNLQDNQAQGQTPNDNDPGWLAPTPSTGDTSDLGGTQTNDILGKLLWTPGETTEIGLKLGYTKTKDDHYAQLIMEPGELNCYLPNNYDGSENNGEVWFETSTGGYCGRIDHKRVNYYENNPFAPGGALDPGSSGTYLGFKLPGTPGLPVQGAARDTRFNIPDFLEGTQRPAFGSQPESWTGSPVRPGSEREQVRTQLELLQDIGEWSLLARINYNKDDFFDAYDLDQRQTRPQLGLFHNIEDKSVEDTSLEAIVSSPADYSVRGSVGVYIFDAETKSSVRRMPGYTTVNGLRGLGLFEPPTIRKIENRSIFGSLDWDISDQWSLTAEARYGSDKKNISTDRTCMNGNSPYDGDRAEDSTDNDSLTPRLTVRYQPTDDVMVYALAAKGNKPAEFNSAFFREPTDPCRTAEAKEDGLTQTEEETAWTYEAGTKTTWWGGRALFNLSAYYIDWQNQATFQTIQLGNTANTIAVNAGKSHVYGVEIESSFALTDNLSASVSYGLANGKYDEYNDKYLANTTGNGLNPNTGELAEDANNAKGNYIPFNSKHSLVTSLSYNRALTSDIGWFFRTDYILESKKYTGASNLSWLGGRDLWNGRLGMDSEHWSASLYINNILDDTTPTAAPSFFIFPSTGTGWSKSPNQFGGCQVGDCTVETAALSPSRGRNVGLDLLFRF